MEIEWKWGIFQKDNNPTKEPKTSESPKDQHHISNWEPHKYITICTPQKLLHLDIQRLSALFVEAIISLAVTLWYEKARPKNVYVVEDWILQIPH